MDQKQKNQKQLLKCILSSHTKTEKQLEKMGCGLNALDLIPTLEPTGISNACKDYIKNDNTPWQEKDKICSLELIDYYEHTNMKKTICNPKKISKDHICAYPVLSKMCYGEWEKAEECNRSLLYHKSK